MFVFAGRDASGDITPGANVSDKPKTTGYNIFLEMKWMGFEATFDFCAHIG